MFRRRLEQALDDLHAGVVPPAAEPWFFYDGVSLSNGLLALRASGDPDRFVCSGTNFPQLAGDDTHELARFVADHQLDVPGDTDGAFPYLLTLGNEPYLDDVQATAYAMQLLAKVSAGYAEAQYEAFRYLWLMTLPSGEVLPYDGAAQGAYGEMTPEIAGEALLGVLAGLPYALVSIPQPQTS